MVGVPCLVWADKSATINKKQVSVEKAGLSADQVLRMKRVFLFPSVDDMSGVLAPKLDEKLVQIFQSDSRFDLVRDSGIVKALSPDESVYAKVAQNQAVHQEAAKVSNADTTVLLRTRNVGTNTEMTLEFRDAGGELLYVESGSIPGYSPMDARWNLIEKLIDTALKRVPFEGTVTGRTANTLTIDLGIRKVKRGDEIELARIVSVQRHPLLKTIVGADYVRVGRAKITSVDKVLSFAEVIEEFPSEFIASGNKVLSFKRQTFQEAPIQESKPTEKKEKTQEEYPKFEEERLEGDFDRPKARYGHVGIEAGYGSLTHSQNASGANSEVSGSGLGIGLEGELWVTRNWILSLAYGSQSASLKGSSANPLDSSWKRAEGFAGYRFFPNGTSEGLAITGAAGYQAVDFDIPTSGSISGKRYAGLAVKADVDVQFVPRQKIFVGVGFQPFSSVTDQAATMGTLDGGNVVGFHLSWNYALVENIWVRLGMRYDAASASYPGASSSTDKRFSIGPALFYSF